MNGHLGIVCIGAVQRRRRGSAIAFDCVTVHVDIAARESDWDLLPIFIKRDDCDLIVPIAVATIVTVVHVEQREADILNLNVVLKVKRQGRLISTADTLCIKDVACRIKSSSRHY